jgi:hypothetical protein
MSDVRRKTTKQPAPKKPEPTSPALAPAAEVRIDATLMERAIALRAEGKTMKAIGVELDVKATGYLARKIKAAYGADTLAPPAKPAATKEG